MEKNVVASLIPDRDSDSSDDEFEDALEEIETTEVPEQVELEPEEDNNGGWRCEVYYGLLESLV